MPRHIHGYACVFCGPYPTKISISSGKSLSSDLCHFQDVRIYQRGAGNRLGKKFIQLVQQVVKSAKITAQELMWNVGAIFEYYATGVFYTACHNNVPKIGWRHKGL